MEEIPQPARYTRSPQIGQLIKALAAATLEFGPIIKELTNPFYHSKYADLAAIIAATAVPLAKQGIVIIQAPFTIPETQEAGVTTLIAHSSDEWVAFELALPVAKWDAHGIGSGITFSGRYSEQRAINVAGELDEDANAAVGKDAKAAAMPQPPSKKDKSRNLEPEKPKLKPEPSWAVQFWGTARTSGRTEVEIRKFVASIGAPSTNQIPEDRREECMRWAKESVIPWPTEIIP